MGNTVNSATANIVHSATSETKQQHKHAEMTGQPPPECPMHNKIPKQEPVQAASESLNNQNDINPLNMVFIIQNDLQLKTNKQMTILNTYFCEFQINLVF